jgi:hypothetical protein
VKSKKNSEIIKMSLKMWCTARRWRLTPVILATQEAEIRRIMAQSQHRQIVLSSLS